jgi:hypothetical protein
MIYPHKRPRSRVGIRYSYASRRAFRRFCDAEEAYMLATYDVTTVPRLAPVAEDDDDEPGPPWYGRDPRFDSLGRYVGDNHPYEVDYGD